MVKKKVSKKGVNKNLIIGVVVVVLLLIGVFFYFNNQKDVGLSPPDNKNIRIYRCNSERGEIFETSGSAVEDAEGRCRKDKSPKEKDKDEECPNEFFRIGPTLIELDCDTEGKFVDNKGYEYKSKCKGKVSFKCIYVGKPSLPEPILPPPGR